MAASYIHNSGGHIPSLHKLPEIWHWCVIRKIWLSVVHISGKDNNTANKLSRLLNEDMELMLKPEVFKIVEQVFGKITVDLFASGFNKQNQRHVSFLPDFNAMAIDAFTFSWTSSAVYYIFHLSFIGEKCCRS